MESDEPAIGCDHLVQELLCAWHFASLWICAVMGRTAGVAMSFSLRLVLLEKQGQQQNQSWLQLLNARALLI